MSESTPSVLIVEDEPIVAEDLRVHLRLLGYENIEKVMSAEEALEFVEKQPPDIVLMDIRLQGEMDGIDAAKLIHERLHLPVIFITAFADEESVERAKEAESFGYILKPFDSLTVKTTIEMALYKHRISEALRLSELKYRSIFTYSPIGIFQANPEHKVITVNPALAALIGCASEEEAVAYLQDLNDELWVDPKDRLCFMEDLKKKGAADIEARIKRKDGRTIWIALTSRFNKDLNLIDGFAVDISERKAAEIRAAEEHRMLLRSISEMQKFTYAASHDLQEPLRIVVSFVQLLQRKYGGKLDKEADEFIGFAVNGARRMQRLLGDLRTYARIVSVSPNLRPISLHKLIDRALSSLQSAIRETGAKVELGTLPEFIVGDGSHLLLLLHHLFSNALKFHGARLPRVRVFAQDRPDEWIVAVSDNGIGIDPKYSERIFEMFERLNDRMNYPGSGMGLPICKKIVEAHNGRIWFESQTGEGTTFYFSLPKKVEGRANITT